MKTKFSLRVGSSSGSNFQSDSISSLFVCVLIVLVQRLDKKLVTEGIQNLCEEERMCEIPSYLYVYDKVTLRLIRG